MIQANELRIGNLIKRNSPYNDYGWINNVDTSVFVIHPKGGTWHYLNQIEPIPLTSEILEKCGFEKEGDTYKVVDKNLDYCFRISFTGSGYFSPNTIAKHPILYLHQLQNLYWCLCGEELTITF